MNKTELVKAIALSADVPNGTAEKVLNAFLENVTSELVKGGDVTLIGFGSFVVKDKAERKGKNPATGEAIVIPARKVPTFKAGKGLKDALNS